MSAPTLVPPVLPNMSVPTLPGIELTTLAPVDDLLPGYNISGANGWNLNPDDFNY
eukprot:CAMPEP_0185912090 /NCGR_PEP_ID=MMETSP0196C-20130402/36284_1 /TAXON_ID=2932 /ORGANISM="Alexandrium fundyense, Strain CCMP1719" /LENGTH=54 /DNA_ID=CAMNT_0028633263 /DNA_START=9 /DNA_END=170 /DNA_ORIENTATION=-